LPWQTGVDVTACVDVALGRTALHEAVVGPAAAEGEMQVVALLLHERRVMPQRNARCRLLGPLFLRCGVG
jgi:hypothetical protein